MLLEKQLENALGLFEILLGMLILLQERAVAAGSGLPNDEAPTGFELAGILLSAGPSPLHCSSYRQ